MAFNFKSYGDYFRSSQNPVCRIYGPTGPTGSGTTGATGPAGPAGTNGISTGLIYYFHAQGPSGQPDPGYTGFVMNTSIRDGPVGGNPLYLPTVYNGYFSNSHPSAGTTGPVLLGEFQTSQGDPGVSLIPAGTWTFLMNVYTGIDYTGVGKTGITGANNTSISVYGEIWKTSQGISSLIGDNKSRPVIVNSATDDQLYTMGINISAPGQTLFIPSTDNMFVRIYAVPTTSTFIANQRIEFWTDGDSVSQVTTTLPARSGNSGPTGPIGPSGPQGLPGANGSAGSQGIQGPMGQSTWTPVLADSTRITQSATTSGVFTKTGGANGGWDASVRSAQAYSSGAYVSFNTPSTPSEVIIGLSDSSPINTTPPLNILTAVTYGINYNGTQTTWYYIESGAAVGAPQPCVAGDSFSIIYDGVNVKYYQNGVVKRTVPRTIGAPLHLESNFYYLNSTTSNLVFGPAGQSSTSYLSNYSIFTTYTDQVFRPDYGIGYFSGSYTTNGSAVVQLKSSPSVLNLDDTDQGFVPTVTGTFLIKILWAVRPQDNYGFRRPIFFASRNDLRNNLLANDKNFFTTPTTPTNPSIFFVGKANLTAGIDYTFWFPGTGASEAYNMFTGSTVEFYLVNS